MHSLVVKLWAAMLAVSLAVLLFLSYLFPAFFASYYFDLRARELVREGEALARIYAEPSAAPEEPHLGRLEDLLATHILLLDERGRVQGRSPGMGMMGHGHRGGNHMGGNGHVFLTDQDLERLRQGETITSRDRHHHQMTGPEEEMLGAAIPLMDPGDGFRGAILLMTPLAPLDETVGAVRQLLLYGAGLAALVAAGAAFFVARVLTRPLAQMSRAARSMADGDFDQQVPVTSRDELGQMGEAMNLLARRLAQTLGNLSREKEQLQSILNSMSDGVVTFASSGDLLLANPRAREILGPDPASLMENPDFAALIQPVLERGEEAAGLLSWGSSQVRVQLAPLGQSHRGPAGAVALLVDVTREQDLERLRREFLASVSHELRTPLSYLQGYGEALQDGVARDRAQEEQYLSVMLEETHRLRRLVEDLMDLAHMEEGHLELELEPLDLGQLLSGMMERVEHRAREKGIALALDLPGQTLQVTGDTRRLQQVVLNLLDNALRHTPAGGRVEVSFAPEEEGVGITVADSGPGIPEAELERIFQRFHKADPARTRTQAGTGLGLAIARQIIAAHGGCLWAENRPGGGAALRLVLPAPGEKTEK